MVNIFADAFQSCLKDGLDGTVDYMMIPSAFITLLVLFLSAIYIPINHTVSVRALSYTQLQ